MDKRKKKKNENTAFHVIIEAKREEEVCNDRITRGQQYTHITSDVIGW